ncbi:MAG: class I SAM-dependent methyltransferase [Beijerinckiaceae bacterium]
MQDLDRRSHWENLYATKAETEVSWFEEAPVISLELIAAAGASPDSAIIDVGGGASRLVDALIERGFRDITVLDLAETALAKAKARLGARAGAVHWITADATSWRPPRQFDVWHDRAVFHFLTEPADQAAYVECLKEGLKPGGHAIIGTFALDGPERCSGLAVARHDSASLARILGPSFQVIETRPHEHKTPRGVIQRFQFSRFRKAVS